MIRAILFSAVFASFTLIGLAPDSDAAQIGPKIKVSKDGKVEVGPVKVDPVPPGARVIERVIKGEPIDKAIDSEVKSRIDDAKSIANIPQIQTEIENDFFDQLRKVAGDDAVDVIEVLRLPEQISRAAPAAAASMLDGPKDIGDVLKTMAGAPLLAALIQAKEYYDDKAIPIPRNVKILLMISFSADTLKKARYVVDDFGGSVPAIINQFQETLGNEHAVTIDNIIVFSATPKDENVFFWAHEMQHTVQYAKLGMEKFAGEYTTNYKSLEDDANTVAANAEKKAVETLEFMQSIAALEE